MFPLQFDRTAFSSVRVERIEARRGVGDHTLLTTILRLQNNAPNAASLPRVIHLSGELRTRNVEHIAELRPVTVKWYANRADGDTAYLSAPVSFSTLSGLNASRRTGGDDVNIDLALVVDLDGAAGWEQHQIPLQHRIPSSDWTSLLAAARHTTLAIVELPTDGEPVPAGLRGSMQRYVAAKVHLQQCQWDDAISECREVLDALATAIGATEPAPPLGSYGTGQQRGWTFEERCAAIRAIVRHGTHTAHHGQTTFSADEARYVVDMTGVILKFYCTRLGR
ncbi:MAG: hypothetical protein KF773_16885 [Deltaproteobacteria bacterium]|nr:hypothetical protein [Deltaproteobacteria bacterium]